MTHAHIEDRRPRRSQRDATERLITGLDTLLAEREFEAIGVREILRASGCSPSSMYGPGRPTTKEDLLNLLHERWIDEFRGSLPVGSGRVGSGGVGGDGIGSGRSPTMDQVVLLMVHYLVACVQSAPLRFRAFRRSQHPEIRDRSAQFYDEVFAILLPLIQRSLPHLDPREVEMRLRFGSRVVIGAACDLCDYGDDMAIGVQLDARQVPAVLSQMVQRFLSGDGDSPPHAVASSEPGPDSSSHTSR